MSKLKLYNLQKKTLLQLDTQNELNRGGEGSIFPHPANKNQVIKIYHNGIKPSISPSSWEYLKKLDDRFIKPIDLYYNDSGVVCGFSMPFLESSFFRLAQLFSKSECTKLGINNTIKIKIARELVSIIDHAHQNQVIIGDFNQFNIFVNQQGEVKILDVDSFETPVIPHSGRLLDEIRDFYYLGKVSADSDYYSLAVNLFRIFTYVHPFKGVHKTWKNLEERAIKQISVLSDDKDLIIPSFYEPIANKQFQDDFKRIFNYGERFLMSVTDLQTTPINTKKSTITYSHLQVKIIAENVVDVYFNNTLGYIKKENVTEIYDCQFSGNLTFKEKFFNKDFQKLMIGNKNLLLISDRHLYANGVLISNFEVPAHFRFIQMGPVIFGVDYDNTYQIYPDKIINSNISWIKNPAWGQGFKFETEPIQITGGIPRVHFRNNDGINSARLMNHVKEIVMQENIGIVSSINQDSIKYNWFTINGLDFCLGPERSDKGSFALKHTPNGTFVFEPRDHQIAILRLPDFKTVDTIEFKSCTAQSTIFMTQSGLLLLENGILYLINRNT